MSSPFQTGQAYQAFLSSSDLDTWTTSLQAYEGLLQETEDLREARSGDVLHALTLALYVTWLSKCYGEDERRDQALKLIDELSARVDRAGQFGGREGSLIQLVIAAAKGYTETARRMAIKLETALPVEIALLTAPQRAAPRAATLKPFVLDGMGFSFVPALYFYGSSLLDLGYLSDAKNLLKRHDGASASSLLIDLRGQLLELAGSWQQARQEYARSQWASHIYRCAVCDLILGESIDGLSAWPEEKAKKFIAGMQDFSGETDRAGVVRSASFIQACRWNGFDNWLVHFELGRLSFQRRRHTEAERHLAAAARAAPMPYRFPIRSLRFTNLTWLNEAMEIDIEPETLEAGYMALQEQAAERDKASIRTWLARTPSESGALDPVLISDDDYARGNAHHLRGSVPDAIECWHSCIERSYTPRAFFELMKVFVSCGFEKTANRLAEIVALESHGSFFDLWELAWAIADILKEQSPARIGAGLLGTELTRVEARLEELVESEFQNALRAFHYFLARRRPAPARRMLLRAEKLAEGSEEHLLLAIARRTAAFGGWDPRVLDALLRAERQSEDRLERLLIAREFVKLGQLAIARAILDEEGVFSTRKDLTPIDYVLSLQCAKLCADEAHRKVLQQAAVQTLQRDVGAGRFRQFGKRFVDRLNSNLSEEALEIAFPTQDLSKTEDSAWQVMVMELDRLQREQQVEEVLRLLNDKVDALSGSDSSFSGFALWGLHLERFDAQLRLIDQLRPNIADEETPLARDMSPLRWRARSLTRLWRSCLLEQQPSQAQDRLGEIRDFLEEERQLTERWDRARNVEAEEPANSIRGFARQGTTLLNRIRSGRKTGLQWPAFLGIREAVVEDAGDLAAQLQQRAELVRDKTGQ